MIQLATEVGKPRSMASVLEGIEAGEAPSAGPVSYSTGFDPLDRALDGGLRGQDLVLVGGGPGVGKTVASLQWARSLAEAGKTAIFASYEHDQASLFARLLLAEIGTIADESDLERSAEVRALVRAIATGDRTIDEVAPGSDLVRTAANRLSGYAGRLWLIRASSAHTGLRQLDEATEDHGAGEAILFVDYLQKVPVQGAPDEGRRVTRITEGLKEIALSRGIAVVAVVAGDRAGLNARRLRMHHLRGSSALAYEADVVVMLNDKFRAVSNVHTAYDSVRAETFKQQVVFTIEKNRDGPSPLDLEFQKDFEHYRFHPVGGYVAERLVDDRFYTE